MARKIVNRKEKRAEIEAAERAGEETKKAKPAKKAASPTRAAKKAAAIRFRLFWGVFNQSMKRVALFDFNQRKQAEKRAEELTKSGKSQHFVQRVKEAVTE